MSQKQNRTIHRDPVLGGFDPKELRLIDDRKARLADLEAYRRFRDLTQPRGQSLDEELQDVGVQQDPKSIYLDAQQQSPIEQSPNMDMDEDAPSFSVYPEEEKKQPQTKGRGTRKRPKDEDSDDEFQDPDEIEPAKRGRTVTYFPGSSVAAPQQEPVQVPDKADFNVGNGKVAPKASKRKIKDEEPDPETRAKKPAQSFDFQAPGQKIAPPPPPPSANAQVKLEDIYVPGPKERKNGRLARAVENLGKLDKGPREGTASYYPKKPNTSGKPRKARKSKKEKKIVPDVPDCTDYLQYIESIELDERQVHPKIGLTQAIEKSLDERNYKVIHADEAKSGDRCWGRRVILKVKHHKTHVF